MRKFLHLFLPDLTIHDGGAAAPAGDGAGAGTGEAGEPAQAGTQTPGSSRRDITGGTQKVLYGKQPEDTHPDAGDKSAQQTKPTQTPEERKAAFKQLVTSEYKDEFSSYFQEQFDKRFKGHKDVQDQLTALSPLVEILGDKYGIADGDPMKLAEAVENDNALWEDLAEEAGLSVDQFKAQQKLRREAAVGREMQAQQDEIRMAQQRATEWIDQAKELKAIYPDFDLQTEMNENPKFKAMLTENHLDVRTAYQSAHFDDIFSGVVSTVGKRAEASVISNIQAKGKRPAEAGATLPSGVIVKNDVTKLTKADRAEIARRAARGEKISF